MRMMGSASTGTMGVASGDGTSAGPEDEGTLVEAGGCRGGERDECGGGERDGGGGGGRDGGGGGDRAEDAVDRGAESVTAMERGTKKAVEVETNAHSTMEM